MMILSACAPEGVDIPDTGNGETPVLTPGLPAKAVLDAQQWLADQLGVEVQELENQSLKL